MAVRILLLLLSIIICTNIVIIIVSLLFNENLYKKHGRVIINAFGGLILFVIAFMITAAVIGVI